MLKSLEVGPLVAIELGHDSRGPSPCWFVDKVVVDNERSGEKATFVVNAWFDADGGDG